MLTIPQKRALLFWFGCIGTRLGLVWLARTQPHLLPYMSAMGLAIAIGFTWIYLGGLRKTGPEAFGDIWWNNLRPVHAALYATFAYYAYHGDGMTASTVLALDVSLGMAAWLYKRI
jgi:hypothetical protein